jgi:hypothetical protein
MQSALAVDLSHNDQHRSRWRNAVHWKTEAFPEVDEAEAVFRDEFVRQEPYLHGPHEVWGLMNGLQVSEGQTRK